MRLLAFVLLLVLVSACASRAPAAYDPNAVRMCIENTAVGYGNFVAYVNGIRFTVYSGEEVCKSVHATAGGLSIRGATTGGGSTGPLRYAFTLPGASSCWHWRISNARTVDIVSCDEAIY